MTTPGAEPTSDALRRVEQERDEANELCDKVAAELRLVTRERDSLARRCSVRFEETEKLRAERDREYERAQTLAAELDLTRRDRDTARHDADMARNNREHLNRLLTRTRDELAAARQERDALIGERRLFARSSWIVARDGGRDCVRCDREIRRGEAYELLPGVDYLQHVMCPDLPEGAPPA